MKEQILKLRSEGKTYNEIKTILGCSKSTISYHCGSGQKEKNKERRIKLRKENPLLNKISHFKDIILLRGRADKFHRKGTRKNTFYETRNFNYTDVIKKYGIETNCYLTGTPVNLLDGNSYELDHVFPRSKGGPNTLENCGIACPKANRAKRDLPLDEFLNLCQDVLKNFGYKVEPPEIK
jgi:5-methylcytosine-specific restriction endonuclease McrA